MGHRWKFVLESFKSPMFRRKGVICIGNSRPFIAHAVHAGTSCVLSGRGAKPQEILGEEFKVNPEIKKGQAVHKISLSLLIGTKLKSEINRFFCWLKP